MASKTWSALSLLVVGFGACTTENTREDDDDGSAGRATAGAFAGGNVGSAGDTNEAGSESSSGRAGSPSRGGAGRAGGAGGAVGGDNGHGGGQAGDGQGGVDGGDSCDGAEAAPNDTREGSTRYTLNSTYAGCLQTAEDIDFYEFTTPAGDGGYVVVKLTDVATTGNVSVELWSAADNGSFASSYTVTKGASVYAYFNAEPSATFRISVQPFSSTIEGPTQYSLLAQYHPVSDAHEPNDLRTMATPITVGEPVEAYLFAGWKNSTSIPDEAWHDWYSLNLAVGSSRTVLSIVASDINGSIDLYDSLGAEIESAYSVTQGSSVQLNYAVTTAGKYYVRVGYFTAPKTDGAIVDVPQYLTEPYTLTVTQ